MGRTLADVDKVIRMRYPEMDEDRPDHIGGFKHRFVNVNGICQLCVLDEEGHNAKQESLPEITLWDRARIGHNNRIRQFLKG